MAKVLLIQPNDDIKNFKKRSGNFHTPSSLIYIGTAIKEKHSVKIFDRNLYPEDKKIISVLKKYHPDIIGFNSMTSPMLFDIIHLGPLIKKILPKSLIIVGGVHATVEPDSVLNEPYVDYIIRGEGESAFLEFCDTFDKGNKNKLKMLDNINKNKLREFVNMNQLKLPDYSLIDLKMYGSKWINTSRGCPGNCSFCYNSKMWGKNDGPFIRMFNTEKTKELFKEAIEKYNINEFTIADDNFTTFKKRCIDVCNFLEKKYKRKISFYISARADSVDKEILDNLKKAGCNTIQYGSESGSQRILNYLNKRETIQTQGEAIILARKCGLFNCSSFMIGIPTETVSEMKETVSFIKKYKPDISDVKFFQPLPGNEIFKNLIKEGTIKKPKTLEEWAGWIKNLKKMLHNYSKIPNKELEKTVKYLWRYRLIRTQLKKTIWWAKKRKIKYILKRIKNNLKI